MKILLDENIDVRFKKAFDPEAHAVFIVKDMGWTGILNGELLRLMEEHAFDVLSPLIKTCLISKAQLHCLLQLLSWMLKEMCWHLSCCLEQRLMRC